MIDLLFRRVVFIFFRFLTVVRNGHGRTPEAVVQIPRTLPRRLRTRQRGLRVYRLVHVFYDHPVRLCSILVQCAVRQLDGRYRVVDFRQRFTHMYVYIFVYAVNTKGTFYVIIILDYCTCVYNRTVSKRFACSRRLITVYGKAVVLSDPNTHALPCI